MAAASEARVALGAGVWALVLATLPAAPALANGQISHLWITEQAVEQLPDGELRALLARDDLRPMLLNGSMFPDGGYAVGDAYGELAHWEPLQDRYLAWIRAHHEPPWSDEAAEHVAFWLGMASHGMADQIYDSRYMERAHVYDADGAWQTESMDEATDVAMAVAVGGREVFDAWVPAAVLAPLFAESAGHVVEPSTIETGQSMLGFAVYYVSEVADNDEACAEYEAQFPWAWAHQLDTAVPGAPPREAEVVAAYWQQLWARLHDGDGWAVLDQVPRAGATLTAREASDLESTVSFSVGRGLDSASVGPDTVAVTDAAGTPVEVDVRLFYGHGSHAVNLRPAEDWGAGERYHVTVGDAVRAFDGAAPDGPLTFSFDAGPPAVGDDDDSAAPEAGGCACAGEGTAAPAPGIAAAVTLLVVGWGRRRRWR